MTTGARDVVIRDVTLRDGLQDEAVVPTADKLALFDALVAAGIPELELTSFVRADRVPAMADAEELARATSPASTSGAGGPVRWGLVLNTRGAQRALAAGIDHLQYVLSVSEPHNRVNAGRDVATSLAELAEVVTIAHEQGGTVELTLATAFGCPYAGPVPVADLARVAEQAVSAGVDGLGLADTIGTGTPNEVAEAVVAVVPLGVTVGAHLHDTRGLAIANALAALEAGATRVDGSVGGLGGCPFAPGASGNVALEDLVHALEAMGLRTGVDVGALVEAARLACTLTARPLGSHVGLAGPRFAKLAEA